MTYFLFIISYLILYSFIGWICESFYISINQKRFINSGFLHGPFCPIYGFGSLGIILFLSSFKSNLFLFILSATLFTSLLEYITSILLEYFFHSRWWDYSSHRFNLNGRICLLNSTLFTIASILLLYVIHPIVAFFILKIPIAILTFISLLLILLLLYDFYYTIHKRKEESV